MLNLPLASQGATPIDLIRRPVVLSNENTANPAVFGQRYFAQASLRILLSDRATDLTGLPTITAGAPVDLANLAASGYVVNAARPTTGRRSPLSPGPEPITRATGVSLTRCSAIAGTVRPTAATQLRLARRRWNNGRAGVAEAGPIDAHRQRGRRHAAPG